VAKQTKDIFKSFATVGGIIEINLIALTNDAARKKQVVETDIPGMGRIWPLHQSWRIPVAVRADSDRP
jgi:hypothetical protein